jgi:2-keto-3-deoxy-L-rhamnonate aldolase RhmA
VALADHSAALQDVDAAAAAAGVDAVFVVAQPTPAAALSEQTVPAQNTYDLVCYCTALPFPAGC